MENEGLENVLTYDGLEHYHRKITGYVDKGDDNSKAYTDIIENNANIRIDSVEEKVDGINGLSIPEIDALTPI